jgi:hypothetical protein
MTFEFQNTLHRTADEMCDAIAGEWLSAGGMNSRETMLGFLAEMTDEQLAAECILGWGFDQPESEDAEETWMDARGADAADIESAFANLRRDFDKRFPAEAA